MKRSIRVNEYTHQPNFLFLFVSYIRIDINEMKRADGLIPAIIFPRSVST